MECFKTGDMSITNTTDAKIRIITFGRFNVIHPDGHWNDSGNRSKKTWDLLKYMVTHKDKRITVDNVMEDLFPSEEYHDPSNTIKNLVYRLRKMIQYNDGVNRKSIVFQKGGYYLNRTNYIDLDTDIFEAVTNNASFYEKKDPVRSIDYLNIGMELYKGSYLPEDTKFDWVIPTRMYYRRMYLKNCIKHMALLRQLKEYEEMSRIGSEAIREEEFEEDIHAMFMEALLRTGKYTQVIQHYEYVSDLFQKMYNIMPSAHLTKLYSSAVESEPIRDCDFNSSFKPSSFYQDSALVCDPNVFRQMLTVEQNRNVRLNKNTYIIRITLQSPTLPSQKPKESNKAISRVQRFLVNSLRSGDVLSRWNENTLLVFMGGDMDENCVHMGCERIRKLIIHDIASPLIKMKIEKLSSTQSSFVD